MSDYFETSLALLRAEMDADAPRTPAELKQDYIARLIREAWLASAELVRLKAQDPEAAPFIASQEGDLWAIKTRIDTLISEIRAEHGERALPPVLRLVRG